ncbi:MAG: penicillin-binding protein [Thermodesulfobacteriota bacterium]
MKTHRKEHTARVPFRIVMVALLFAVGATILVVRAYRLQVTQADRLQKRAEKQRTKVLHLESRRGMILDRSGEPLAASLEVKSICARPHLIADKEKTAHSLAQTLETDEQEVLAKLIEDKPFVWVRRQMPPALADKVKALRLTGVFAETEYGRFYPQRTLAAHVIGFSGTDSKGLEGLELFYDTDLKADPIPVTAQRDALGRPVMFAAMGLTPKRRDLHLTIDRNIQHLVERELAAAVQKEQAKSGTAIVLSADSGEVLALAVTPAYNLNTFDKASAGVIRNRAVVDTFEPGSTFKVFLAAAALDLNRMNPDESFDCHQGLFKYKGTEVHDVTPYKTLSFTDILVHSSNIGAVQISDKLKKSEFFMVLKGFGFGTTTGIDLPGERSGRLAPPGRWSALTKPNIAFGQGISVNAIQMVAAFAAAVNGGVLYKPQLVRRITNARGDTVKETRPLVVRRVIKESTSAQLVEILRQVVTRGTGKLANIPGVQAIGKTGTAQKAEPSGGYSTKRYVASFVGALMESKPRLVIFVALDEPNGTHKTGGKIAAPLFSRIGSQILSLRGTNPQEVPVLLTGAERNHRSEPTTPKQTVKPRMASNPGEWIIPDLRGLSVRQVIEVCEEMKCEVFVRGTGLAVGQNPGPGATLKEGSPLEVSFEGSES